MEAFEDTNGQRVTGKQREVMLAFMREHPALCTGRFCTTDGAKHRSRLVRELSDRLNAVGNGGTKTPDKWMKCWQDWKSDVKKKAAKIKRHVSATGGGPACRLQLTPLEEDLVALIGLVAVTGLNTTDLSDAQTSTLSSTTATKANDSVKVSRLGFIPPFDSVDMWVNTTMDVLPSIPPSLSPPIVQPESMKFVQTTDQRTGSTESDASSQKKRKRCLSLTESQEETKNTESLRKEVELKENRFHFEMMKYEKEITLKEREITLKDREITLKAQDLAVKEKMAEAVKRSASAMEAMAVAVTAAMRAFQCYLEK